MSAPSNGALPIKRQQITRLRLAKRGSRKDCAWAEIVIQGEELVVNPSLAVVLLERYPSLALHACKSGKRSQRALQNQKENTYHAGTFGEYLVGALLPHAVEHLAIELLVTRFSGESFAGNTSWVSRAKKSMKVRVSVPQEGTAEDALEALSDAIVQLNELLASGK